MNEGRMMWREMTPSTHYDWRIGLPSDGRHLRLSGSVRLSKSIEPIRLVSAFVSSGRRSERAKIGEDLRQACETESREPGVKYLDK